MQLIRARKSGLNIELTSLIDVVFQLLVFFMLTSTFAQPSIKMVLPKAVTADQSEVERIVISIDEERNMFLNNEPVVMDDLQQEIKEKLEELQTQTIFIRGDQNMPYKYFVELTDMARQSGAVQINLLHQRAE